MDTIDRVTATADAAQIFPNAQKKTWVDLCFFSARFWFAILFCVQWAESEDEEEEEDTVTIEEASADSRLHEAGRINLILGFMKQVELI